MKKDGKVKVVLHKRVTTQTKLETKCWGGDNITHGKQNQQ
jgi:hypothetical protein